MKTGIVASVAKHIRGEHCSLLVAACRHGPDMDAPYTLPAGSMCRKVVRGTVLILPTKADRD
jgi:hypothetical protein